MIFCVSVNCPDWKMVSGLIQLHIHFIGGLIQLHIHPLGGMESRKQVREDSLV